MPPSQIFAWKSIDFTLVFIMWAVMMVAMMLPSAVPMVLSFSRVCQQRQKSVYQLSMIFTLAYLCIWILFSVSLTLLQWQFHGLEWLTPMMENQSTLLAGAIFIFAGGYQFSSLKNACLRHCRTPMGFLLNEWKEGNFGAFKMGLKHGATCLGCCWVQMLIMFAVGVMNLLGMALITLLVIMEKLLPIEPVLFSRAVGSVFIFWGIFLLIVSP